ncbi:phosphoribosylglycinamide formyltransferase [Schizopora paradoxa]|uniref:Phosphoribosylglycinamide formyltransferase n=1 Tax=Schizopora paradoxa TaxID=27342 RepID=A0A0H2S6R2_9AGAM|nr:phosphoribosylglycinamide formyltransferase [Schizopora paradoxa]
MTSTEDVKEKRIVVLISGSGTNLQALIDAQNGPLLPKTRIIRVISNRKAAYGLTRATSAGIATAYLALQPYLKTNPGKTREDYDEEIARLVLGTEDDQRPDLVVLAGWMHILGERFLSVLEGKASGSSSSSSSPNTPIPVINLHPALPGAFDGANAIERAYAAFQEGSVTKTGCMVHHVIKDVDRGAPIIVREIPFEPGEALEEFEKRLHAVEWEIVVLAASSVLFNKDQSQTS